MLIETILQADLQIGSKYVNDWMRRNNRYYIPVKVVGETVFCESYHNDVINKGQPNDPEAPIYTHIPTKAFILEQYEVL